MWGDVFIATVATNEGMGKGAGGRGESIPIVVGLRVGTMLARARQLVREFIFHSGRRSADSVRIVADRSRCSRREDQSALSCMERGMGCGKRRRGRGDREDTGSLHA